MCPGGARSGEEKFFWPDLRVDPLTRCTERLWAFSSRAIWFVAANPESIKQLQAPE